MRVPILMRPWHNDMHMKNYWKKITARSLMERQRFKTGEICALFNDNTLVTEVMQSRLVWWKKQWFRMDFGDNIMDYFTLLSKTCKHLLINYLNNFICNKISLLPLFSVHCIWVFFVLLCLTLYTDLPCKLCTVIRVKPC